MGSRFDANNNASQWSGPADFTVNATLGSAPTGLTPSGTIANNRPTFTWTPTAGAVSYEISGEEHQPDRTANCDQRYGDFCEQ